MTTPAQLEAMKLYVAILEEAKIRVDASILLWDRRLTFWSGAQLNSALLAIAYPPSGSWRY
jgi:hypothetical protein